TDGKFATADWWPRLAYLTLYVGITAVCVFPPAFLLGMSFPITQKAVQDDRDLVAHRVGLIQLFNIFGNTCGAIVTGLALLHWLGASGTIRLIGIAGLGFLVALIWNVRRSREHIRWSVSAAVLALAVLAFPENSRFWSQLHGATSSGETVVGEDRTGVVVLRHQAKSEVHYGDDVGSDAELL